MAWELLRTDYKDAVWEGLKKYTEIKNSDGTISLRDVTTYTVYEEAFFGAKDANKINTAVNAILAALEQGTDLYEVFTQFFENQKLQFADNADQALSNLEDYVSALEGDADQVIAQIKTDYGADLDSFEKMQEALFSQWFNLIKDQLSKDAAGNLQLQIETLAEREFRHYMGLVNQTTEFLSDKSIVQESDEAIITTEKGVNEDGYKTITQTVFVKSDSSRYVKTTTIIPATETENKKITEEYNVYGLAAYTYVAEIVSSGGTVAGPDTLGMVKIGQGLEISEDGTLSVNVETSAEKAASIVEQNMDDFTDEEVTEVFDTAENGISETDV